MTMKRGGQGSSSVAAATMVLLVALMLIVAASMPADAAAVPRRLGEPTTNNCSFGHSNPGPGCHVPPGNQAAAAHKEAPSRRLISVSKASAGPSTCTNDPNSHSSKKCPTPPAKTP
ncbi:unnamed protein product [Urochloa humidicola]